MNIIKNKAGTLVILSSFTKKSIKGKSNTYLNILCFCGNKFVVRKGDITRDIYSCGCYAKKMKKISPLKHHHCKDGNITRTYYTWMAIKQLCMNKNTKDYPTHGGRGISVCDDWMVFENFLKDMGEKPIGFRLNRKDKDGNFDIENCEWVPMNKKKKYRERNIEAVYKDNLPRTTYKIYGTDMLTGNKIVETISISIEDKHED